MKNKVKKWAVAALIRAARTFAQTAASMFTIGQLFSEIEWKAVLSVSGVAAVYSLIMSVGGIPEVKEGEE